MEYYKMVSAHMDLSNIDFMVYSQVVEFLSILSINYLTNV